MRILEIYASQEAYQRHIATDHFLRYKQGTMHMVKSLKLSDMRAFSVVAELSTRYGIDRSRLNVLGKGLEQPVASNADEAGRARNRRVELVRR